MKIAFLGGGNMAGALIGGLVAKGFEARSISVIEVSVAARERYAEVARAYEALKRDMPVDTLSMGMSDDLEVAIEEGATMVRIGTAIFGQRRKERSAA